MFFINYMEFSSISRKEAIALVSIVIGILSYLPYFRDMIRGTTRPHIFSRFLWGLLTGIAFFGQMSDGAGLAAWVTWTSSLLCLFTAAWAFFHQGKKDIARSDWYAFFAALFSLVVWWYTENAYRSMILITVIDAISFRPTLRKGRYQPDTETASTYALNWFKFVLVLISLAHISVITALYPFSLVFMNGGFAVLLRWRREKMQRLV